MANPYRRTRHDHGTETAEDYVELVADLHARHGEARVVDMAKALGLSSGTVTRTVQRLEKDGYLESPPYRGVFLTTKGEELAAACRERHEIVEQFLLKLGVPEAAAKEDAEGIEHHVSEATLTAMRKWLKK